jgi:hypothetical protein
MIQTVPLRLVGQGVAHLLSDVLLPASQTVVAGTLYSVYVGLFSAWPGFSLNLVLSQLTEVVFGGYARQKVTWGDTGIDGNQRPSVLGSLAQFQPTDSSASSTAIGVLLADSVTAGRLLGVGLLANSKVMGTPVDMLGIIPRFAIPGVTNPDWGEIAGVS